ncbi:collagen alpha-4(VI) chain [Elysia marginata]|uniref:Collagen alpha-4(VI) chain n=1 Tax=Elysia marginata TaxID=1093978 RepID=A0AAV4G6Q1_9GAST|nr:collagen alpha-4(VI) chain [Elysia marginata]
MLLLFHPGFDFSLDPYTPDSTASSTSRQVCGVLRCSEALSDRSDHQTNRSRTVTGLTISKIRIDGFTMNSHERWQQLASVTPSQPSLKRVSDGVKAIGQLSAQKASITLDLSKTNDCMESQFSCVAVFVDDHGRTSIKRAFVGKAVDSSNLIAHTQAEKVSIPSQRRFPTPSVEGNLLGTLMQLVGSIQTKIDFIGSRLEDSLRALENRVEDKVGELRVAVNDKSGGLDKSIESRFGTLDTRMNNLENRLEDKMTQLHNRLLQNLKQVESSCPDSAVICDELALKLNDIGDKVEINIEKLDSCVAAVKRQNESTGKALEQIEVAVGQCAGTEDSKLVNLVRGVDNLSDLTRDVVSQVNSFRDGYGGGALVPIEEFFDPLNTGKKEWRLAFRGTAFNNIQVYPAYLYGTGIPVEVEKGCKQFNNSLPCINHYRNKDALDNWARVDEVLFAIYKDGQMVKRVVFNGKGSNFINWFAEDNVILSSWTDLTKHSHNFFSIAGAEHDVLIRRFFINLDYDRSCDGYRGWFKATETQKGCPEEINTPAIPMFHYAPGNTYSVWTSTFAVADAFGIFLKYE